MNQATGTSTFDLKTWFASSNGDDTIIGVRKGDLKNTLESLMAEVGERGIPIDIRFDPLRIANKYTICVADELKAGSAALYARRLCDTDEPKKAIQNYLNELRRVEK